MVGFGKQVYLVLILGTDGLYDDLKVSLDPGQNIGALRKGDHRYRFKREKAYILKGWNPFRPDGWFSDLFNAIDRRKRFILVYSEGVEDPLDRIPEVHLDMTVNPRIIEALTRSRLYDDYLKKLNYGGGISPVTMAIVLVGLVGFLMILWMGGYF